MPIMTLVIYIAALFLTAYTAEGRECAKFAPARKAGQFESGLIDEASGIAASRTNPGVLWVHNDSGDAARVYAINTKGAMLGIYSLTDIAARDVEDIAVGPGPVEGANYLYIGDIGDNGGGRRFVTIYRVVEPLVDVNKANVRKNLGGVETIRLRYPTGPRDAETLMVDPRTKDLYIISKREDPSRVYRAAYPQSTKTVTTLEAVGTLPWGGAVAGDISPAGDMVIVRGYLFAGLWQCPKGTGIRDVFSKPHCQAPVAMEPQGEAICFSADGNGYYTTSEGMYRPIYYFARERK